MNRLTRIPVLARARNFASHSGSPLSSPNTVGPYQVFDRYAKRLQKDRSARRDDGEKSRTTDYVRDEVADRMMDRLLDIKRKFNTILDLGSGPGHLSKLLDAEITKKVVMLDSSEKLLHREPDSEFEVDVERIHADEERLLDVVAPNSQEAILSCLSLHWINDLPGVLVQIKEALQPDGVFIGAMFGGDTLFELRTSLQLAQLEREGGISPHVSPMTDTRDVSNLLGRAGFALLTVDVDEVRVAYPSMFELMEDLRDMGENNTIVGRRNFVHRDTLAAASAIYKALHGNEDGSVPATFQIIWMIGWKPAPNQPKPLERGSGKTNLKDVL
ncbi:S-adenosyl-L-methionine-dependent methyltransferase [Neolentinus lepideus HHB14362 ss-1]|uniref:S-adenosyl-L-methionine-dependent methyltransferase n=1 Tax=Neolentinus lepideus HHB14362 ss-1 TaxID=1314782 RepID=A0A165USK7_9AGAM|nr:S-adenosyl-L-methionine-dependent methyltransferase [Neolentinus lepideus HHB14362 ss-1]